LSEKLAEDIIAPITLAPAVTRVQAEKHKNEWKAPHQNRGRVERTMTMRTVHDRANFGVGQKRKRTQDTRHKTQDSRPKTKGTRQTPTLFFNRKTWVVFGVGFLVFGLLLAGCAEEQQYGAVEPICVDPAPKLAPARNQETKNDSSLTKGILVRGDKLQAMEIAEDVLAKMHFTIEKADASPATPGIDTGQWRGFIRTRPLAGAQFFEFWRSDTVGADNWLESNLHSIRRVVELTMSEQQEGSPQSGSRLCINCEVQKYRLSMPEHHVSSSARAYKMFSESNSAFQNLRLNPEQKAGMAWIDLGKDRQLAAEILKRIEEQIDSKRATSDEI